MMRLATSEDIPRLKEIWALCFGDTSDFIDFYFAHRFHPREVMVSQEETGVSAMLSMLPLSLQTPRQTYQAAYIYAVATHPDFQRQGISGRLLEHTHTHLQRRGIALSVLVPSSQSLFDFYRRHGYRIQLNVYEQRYRREELPSAQGKLSPLTVQDFLAQREGFLSPRGSYFAWDEAALGYQIELSRMSGGVFQMEVGNISGYVVAEKYKDTLYLKESSFQGDQLRVAAACALEQLGGTSCVVRGPAAGHASCIRPFALAVCYQDVAGISGAYLGLVLD